MLAGLPGGLPEGATVLSVSLVVFLLRSTCLKSSELVLCSDAPFVGALGASVSWPGESPGGLPKGMLNDSSFGII